MTEPQKPQIVFFLKNGVRIATPVIDPANFNFILMIKSMRADGHLFAPGLYIEADSIAAAAYETDGAPVQVLPPEGTILQ